MDRRRAELSARIRTSTGGRRRRARRQAATRLDRPARLRDPRPRDPRGRPARPLERRRRALEPAGRARDRRRTVGDREVISTLRPLLSTSVLERGERDLGQLSGVLDSLAEGPRRHAPDQHGAHPGRAASGSTGRSVRRWRVSPRCPACSRPRQRRPIPPIPARARRTDT